MKNKKIIPLLCLTSVLIAGNKPIYFISFYLLKTQKNKILKKIRLGNKIKYPILSL